MSCISPARNASPATYSSDATGDQLRRDCGVDASSPPTLERRAGRAKRVVVADQGQAQRGREHGVHPQHHDRLVEVLGTPTPGIHRRVREPQQSRGQRRIGPQHVGQLGEPDIGILTQLDQARCDDRRRRQRPRTADPLAKRFIDAQRTSAPRSVRRHDSTITVATVQRTRSPARIWVMGPRRVRAVRSAGRRCHAQHRRVVEQHDHPTRAALLRAR